jgi:hypothetical protein
MPRTTGSSLGVSLVGTIQHANYLVNALAAWRDGLRRNDPSGQMVVIAKSLDDQDVRGVAAYHAQLPPPGQPRDADVAAAPTSSAASAIISGTAQGSQGVGTEQTPVTGGAQGAGGGAAQSTASPAASAASR